MQKSMGNFNSRVKECHATVLEDGLLIRCKRGDGYLWFMDEYIQAIGIMNLTEE